MKERIFCITGIDTDIGKTVATGLIAKALLNSGINVITQKIAQTGCSKISEDIVQHRKIMGVELYDVDHEGITCPYLFSVPCSPHLAAKLDGRSLDIAKIKQNTQRLLARFDLVLLEGVGGLSVPLTDDFTLLDYLEGEKYPLILVSGSKLGSINHTLSALELAKWRKLHVAAIIYNCFTDGDERIKQDSRRVFGRYMKRFGFLGPIIEIEHLSKYQNKEMAYPDFSAVTTSFMDAGDEKNR